MAVDGVGNLESMVGNDMESSLHALDISLSQPQNNLEDASNLHVASIGDASITASSVINNRRSSCAAVVTKIAVDGVGNLESMVGNDMESSLHALDISLSHPQNNLEDASSLEESLINKVRSNPILWDSNRDDYRDKNKRDATWREIAFQLHITDADCMNKWRSLRERYGRELKKPPSGSTGRAGSKSTRLQSMSFLKNYIRTRGMKNSDGQQGASSLSADGDILPTVNTAPGTSTDIISEMSLDDIIGDSTKDSFSPPPIAWTDGQPVRKRRRDLSNFFLSEVKAVRGSVERLTEIVAGEALPEEPRRQRSRIQALCDLITDRYNALSEPFRDEFEISVLQLMMEYTRQNKQFA